MGSVILGPLLKGFSTTPKFSYRSVNALGQASLLEADYNNNLYFYNGYNYGNETAFNTAAGITKSGVTRTFSYNSPFNRLEMSGYVTATTASSGSGTETLLQLDDGTESNRIRIEYEWSTGNVYSNFTISGTNVRNTLGTVSASTQFTVSWVASSSRLGFAAWLTGGNSKYMSVASVPTFTNCRLGKNTTGSTWTGSISKMSITPYRNSWGNALMLEGDSYTGGSTGIGTYIKSLGRTTSSHGGGLGGSIPADNTANNPADIGIVARMLQYNDFFDNTVCIYDGNAPGGVFQSTSSSSADANAYLDQLWTGMKEYKNFVICTPAILPSSLGINQNFNNIVRTTMKSRWPTQTVDTMDFAVPNNGVELDISAMDPGSTGHLNDTNKANMASAVISNLTSRGL